MNIPGSEYLAKTIHATSQSLLIPVILCLLFFLVVSFVELGAFMAEVKKRRVDKTVNLMELFHDMANISPWQMRNLQQVIDGCSLLPRQKKLLSAFLTKAHLPIEAKKLMARDILDREEFHLRKVLEKTDLLAKLGPVMGLMGTLIPLGPGLAALGQGDVQGLSEAIIIAFDTTVTGIAAGAVAALISKVRRRWYEQDLSNMELLLELSAGGECRAVQEKEAEAAVRRRC